jgi:uncharacterized membrane protein
VTVLKVLLAGESWFIYSVHQKGFDSFVTCEYGEGREWLESALKKAGIEVEYIPNHLAPTHFPLSKEELQGYQVIILSDIGSNTLLLHPRTVKYSEATPNRLELIKDYVAEGGGLIMYGGWMSFQGIEGKAHYKGTPIEEILPVILMEGDDRVEVPQGFSPRIVNSEHPILKNIPSDWPPFLSYNRLKAKENATLLAEYEGDTIFAVWEYGKGRTAAFAADIAPHGATKEFLEWEYFQKLWSNTIRWLAREL